MWNDMYVYYGTIFFDVRSMLLKNKVFFFMWKALCGVALCISLLLIRLAVRKNHFGSLGEGKINN